MPPGSVVRLEENGVPADFIVAMHDYAKSNVTLLVRSENMLERAWQSNSAQSNYTYDESTLAMWYQNTYLPKLDEFSSLLVPITPGATATSVEEAQTDPSNEPAEVALTTYWAFAPSMHEFGCRKSTETPTGNIIDRLARYEIWKHRMGQSYWTRDTEEDSDGYTTEAYYITVGGDGSIKTNTDFMYQTKFIMVCLCVSADCIADEDGLLRVNHAPEIVSEYLGTESVSAKRNPFRAPYLLIDQDGDALTVTESIDGVVKRTYEGYTGQRCVFEVTKAEFDALEAETNHTLTVTVTDGSITITGNYTFYKSVSSGYRVFVGRIKGKGVGYFWETRELLHDVTSMDDRFVLEPYLTLEKNDPGSFSCKIPVSNPARKLMQLKKAVISVEEDGQEIWCGYVTEMTPDYDLNLEIYCTGELGYLQDMPCRVENKVYTINEIMTLVTTCPDSRFRTEGKTFLKGTVNVTKPMSKSADKEETSYTTCWGAAKTCLTEKFNGILRLRKTFKMEDGVKVWYRYLDYLKDVSDSTKQVIEFGSNLLDISYYMKAYSIVNSVKAYGYTKSGWWIFEKTKPIDVTVNNEKSIALYGLSQRCIVVDGTKSDTASLRQVAQTELDKQDSGLNGGIEINAGDLADAGVDVDRLSFLKKTRVKSGPHGIDDWVLCTKEEIPIDALDQKKFTFGDTTENISASLAAGMGTAGKAWSAIQSTIGYIKNGG